MTWLNKLDEGALVSSLQKHHVLQRVGDLTFEEMGNELELACNPNERGFGFGAQLWGRLKTEFRLLVCDRDPKYDDLRKELGKLSDKSTTAFVALISSSLGTMIGATATVISPIVALLLLATIRLGVASFCSYPKSLEQPVLKQDK